MEHFIIYMAKAAGLTGLFYLAYHFLLRKETFFNTNRWYLLAGLTTAVTLPLLVYRKVVWVEPVKKAYREIDLNQLMMMQQQAAIKTTPVVEQAAMQINWFDVIAGIYLAGAAFFLIRFFIELISLRKLLKGTSICKEGRFLLVDTPKIKSPFSFFNYIVYNSALLKPAELESIISHEKVHSSQRHSLDMVISQLFCALFWFNPFAWMYRKSISQNLEFIADAGAIKYIQDKEAYQKTLLKITMQPECIAITNHFYQSLIKKRIVMLNKQQSSKSRSWKYAVVLPALAAFMLAFQVKVVAQEKEAPETKAVTQTKIKIAIEVNKDSKDDELKAESKVFKDEFDANVNFQNITRNQKNEITGIKVSVKDKAQSKVYEVAGTEPIAPFTIEMEKGNKADKTVITFGSPRPMRLTADHMYYNEGDSISKRKIIRGYSSNVIVPPVPPAPPVPGAHGYAIPPAPPAPPAPPSGSWTVNSLKIGNNDMLIVINGIKQEKGESIKLALDEEIDSMTILKEKEGKKKYGKDGKKGVVEITTKKSNSWAMMKNPRAYIYPGRDEQSLSFNFDFTDEDMARSIKDNLKIIEGFNFNELESMFNSDDMQRLQQELGRAQIEIQKAMDEAQLDFEGQNITSQELAKIRKELQQARQEIMQSRKEMMETRREMMKERKGSEKAKTEASQARKTVYRKA